MIRCHVLQEKILVGVPVTIAATAGVSLCRPPLLAKIFYVCYAQPVKHADRRFH